MQSMMQEKLCNSQENPPTCGNSVNDKQTPSSSNCVINAPKKNDNCQAVSSGRKSLSASCSRDYFTMFEDDIPVKKDDLHKKENDILQGKSCPVQKESSFEDFLDPECCLLSSSSGSESSSDSSFIENCKR